MLLVYYEMANALGGYTPTSCPELCSKDQKGFGQTEPWEGSWADGFVIPVVSAVVVGSEPCA